MRVVLLGAPRAPHQDCWKDDVADGCERLGSLLGPAGVTARPSREAVAQIAADPEKTNAKTVKKVPTPRPEWGGFRPGLAQAALRVAAMFGYQEG